MVDKMAFLKAYNIDEDDFKAADISWEELAAIYDDYLLKEEKWIRSSWLLISSNIFKSYIIIPLVDLYLPELL